MNRNIILCIIVGLSALLPKSSICWDKECTIVAAQDPSTMWIRSSDFHYPDPSDSKKTCYIQLEPQERTQMIELLQKIDPQTSIHSAQVTAIIQQPTDTTVSAEERAKRAVNKLKLLQELKESNRYKTVGDIIRAIEAVQEPEGMEDPTVRAAPVSVKVLPAR